MGTIFNIDDLPLEGRLLKKLITLCDINIQDVRQSIAGDFSINYIFGNKQVVINQVYDYLEKDSD